MFGARFSLLLLLDPIPLRQSFSTAFDATMKLRGGAFLHLLLLSLAPLGKAREHQKWSSSRLPRRGLREFTKRSRRFMLFLCLALFRERFVKSRSLYELQAQTEGSTLPSPARYRQRLPLC